MTLADRIANRILELETVITELRSLLAAAEPTEDAGTPEPEDYGTWPEERPAAEAKPAKHAPGRNGTAPKGRGPGYAPKAVSVSPEKVLAVAKCLAENGPLATLGVAKRVGFSKATVLSAFNAQPTWFHKTGGLFSPWEVTEEGRAAADAAARG